MWKVRGEKRKETAGGRTATIHNEQQTIIIIYHHSNLKYNQRRKNSHSPPHQTIRKKLKKRRRISFIVRLCTNLRAFLFSIQYISPSLSFTLARLFQDCRPTHYFISISSLWFFIFLFSCCVGLLCWLCGRVGGGRRFEEVHGLLKSDGAE